MFTPYIIVNYNTFSQTRRCIDTLLDNEPDSFVILIDGSTVEIDLVSTFASRWPASRFIMRQFRYNIHHGPGMDFGLKTARLLGYNRAITLDSDMEIKKKNLKGDHGISDIFNKAIQRHYTVHPSNPSNWLGCGHVGTVDELGYTKDIKPESKQSIRYLHPCIAMINISRYLEVKPAILHGAPLISMCLDAQEKNAAAVSSGNPEQYTLIECREVDARLTHKISGTASIHGYNLPAEKPIS